MLDINDHNYDPTDDESEIAQAHSIHLHLNAIANHRRKMESAGPSLSHCIECGDEIPLARQQAVSGCKMCIHCQTQFEKFAKVMQ